MEKQTIGKTEPKSQQDYADSAYKGETGLNDLGYDWVSLLYHKTKGLRACSQYLEDARQAKSQACVDLLERICESDRRLIEEIKQHVVQVISGKMGQGGRPTH